MEKRKAKAKSQETSFNMLEIIVRKESNKERMMNIAELRCLKERQVTLKEFKILIKDTPKITKTQLTYHNELCKYIYIYIKERHELD